MTNGDHFPQTTAKDVKRQIGGSLTGSNGTYMVPIEASESTPSSNPDQMKVTLVSPAQQTVEQAKTELGRENKGIKRKRSRKTVSPLKKRRKVNTSKGRSKRKKKHVKKSNLKYKKILLKGRKKIIKKGKKQNKKKIHHKKSSVKDIFS